jgi:hypothetical protein
MYIELGQGNTLNVKRALPLKKKSIVIQLIPVTICQCCKVRFPIVFLRTRNILLIPCLHLCANHNRGAKIPLDHLLLDRSLNIGSLNIDKVKNC